MKTLNRITTATNDNGAHTAPTPKKTKKAKGFQFKVEHCANQNIVIIHTKKVFPKAQTDPIFSMFNESVCCGNKHPLIKSIYRLRGVVNVRSDRYRLDIEKFELFSWEEILPKVRRALKKHFADGKELDELPACRPSAEYLETLRHQVCDVSWMYTGLI